MGSNMSMHRFGENKWLVMNVSPGMASMDKLVDKACGI
jgi:hypothetical protein